MLRGGLGANGDEFAEEVSVIAPGPLVLAGGAEFYPAMESADRVWLDLLASRTPRLAVLPTAADQRPDLAARNGSAYFSRLGCEAQACMITTSSEAAGGEALQCLSRANAAYLTGGNPAHLEAVLRNSAAWHTLRRQWQEGMGLAGSSAGAMVLCEAMSLRNRWLSGLGLIKGAVVLPHFEKRGGPDMASFFAEKGVTGLGIDESTAMIWYDRRWRVAGPGRVVVIEAGQARTFRDGEEIEGAPQPAEGASEGEASTGP